MKYTSRLGMFVCGVLFLIVLSACGNIEPSLSDRSEEQDELATDAWESVSVDLSELGYTTELYNKIDVEDCTFEMQHGKIITYRTNDGMCDIQEISLDGTLQHEVSLTFPEPHSELVFTQFVEESVYALFSDLEPTENADQSEAVYFLQRCNADGTVSWQKTLSQIIDEAATNDTELLSDCFVMEDRVLVATAEHIYCLSPDGQIQSVSDGAGEHIDFCATNAGDLFVKCAFSIYNFDLENNCLGDEVFYLSNGERVLPGNEPYDFLLLSDTNLRGIELEARCMTDLVSWQDCDLTSSVDNVINLKENLYLISVYETIRGDMQLLLLSFLPEDELPHKETVRMAVGAEYGANWLDALDTQTVYAINAFNRASKDYHIEIETYSSAQDLQLMMTYNAPEIIVFNYAMDDPPSPQLYANKGYLDDITPFLEKDPELHEDDFLPNVLNAFRLNDTIWALPSGFYVTTQYVPREYAEQVESWDVENLYYLMKNISDEYCVSTYLKPEWALSEFLEHCMDAFVNLPEKTCDFMQPGFYELLYLCRDYCCEGTELVETVMLNGSLASTIMEGTSFLRDDISFVGYPGEKGNGSALNCPYLFSITSYGKNKDGAWSFLRTLFLPKVQDQNTTLFPINKHSFTKNMDYLKDFFSERIDSAEFDAAEQLILGATSCESLHSPVISIVVEESAAFFNGDKSAEEVAEIIQSRVIIYLSEQS